MAVSVYPVLCVLLTSSLLQAVLSQNNGHFRGNFQRQDMPNAQRGRFNPGNPQQRGLQQSGMLSGRGQLSAGQGSGMMNPYSGSVAISSADAVLSHQSLGPSGRPLHAMRGGPQPRDRSQGSMSHVQDMAIGGNAMQSSPPNPWNQPEVHGPGFIHSQGATGVDTGANRGKAIRHDQNMAFNTATKQLDAQLHAPDAQGQAHSLNTISRQNTGNARISASSPFQSVMASPDIISPTPILDRPFDSPVSLANQGELPSDMQRALSQTTGSSNQLWDTSGVNQQHALGNTRTEIFTDAKKISPRRNQPTLSEQNGANIMQRDSSSVVDPRFGIISSPDHIATMEVGSSLGNHRPPPGTWHASIQQQKTLHPQQNLQMRMPDHPGMHIATPPPQRYQNGMRSLGLLSDSFVVSDGESYVNTDAEVKVRSGLSAIARQTPRPPPTQPPPGNYKHSLITYLLYCNYGKHTDD